ncbi:hypothetical protein ZHAS_00016217 [Anopheles sinensis]|uniref:Uncharacterized protein n=1 Tax=Anopheles sinensis TaxID=74873 RepID=A0A084WD24_ANOSI|nr:hypothetical protein ZHAS_00016217 [Anopheles sinensis]
MQKVVLIEMINEASSSSSSSSKTTLYTWLGSNVVSGMQCATHVHGTKARKNVAGGIPTTPPNSIEHHLVKQ